MTHPNHPSHGPEIKNLMLALVAATVIMLGWQYFYERPRLAAQQAAHAIQEDRNRQAPEAAKHTQDPVAVQAANVPRIKITTPSLHGSIALVGSRFDDLALAKYHDTTDKGTTAEVKLLSPAAGDDAYFAETGLLASNTNTRVPDETTRWQANGTELSAQKPLILTWNNGAGLTFERKIELDENYMFTITTTVKNAGNASVTLYPYGLVSRNYADTKKHYIIMHEGPLGVVGQGVEDVTYKKLREDGDQKFAGAHGWIGMTDKYWLTALIPADNAGFDAEFKHFKRGEQDAYQADLRGDAMTIPASGSASVTMHFFAGAKVVELLDGYSAKYKIPFFDRAVDFGSLYFLTKPIFRLLNYFYGIVGNFGVAILLLTVCIKALLFPLASKSMTAMSRTKLLMPKITEIRERHADDKMKMNQEIMALYKREKVNPAAGCLPILLQIPVFLSLYRVLFVTIEMRQAPFFGWIHDLSVPDPTNIFTAFGYLPWDAPHLMHLGIWPMVMCVTMVIQQRLNPKPADEVQAAMMTYMPFIFLFLFASFPAGLIIYWAWNNTLSILQQLYINSRLKKKGLR